MNLKKERLAEVTNKIYKFCLCPVSNYLCIYLPKNPNVNFGHFSRRRFWPFDICLLRGIVNIHTLPKYSMDIEIGCVISSLDRETQLCGAIPK